MLSENGLYLKQWDRSFLSWRYFREVILLFLLFSTRENVKQYSNSMHNFQLKMYLFFCSKCLCIQNTAVLFIGKLHTSFWDSFYAENEIATFDLHWGTKDGHSDTYSVLTPFKALRSLFPFLLCCVIEVIKLQASTIIAQAFHRYLNNDVRKKWKWSYCTWLCKQ